MNLIQQIEAEQIEKLTANRKIPDFRPGDTLRVSVKVVEGTRAKERLKAAAQEVRDALSGVLPG